MFDQRCPISENNCTPAVLLQKQTLANRFTWIDMRLFPVLMIFLALLLTTACHQVTLVVKGIPANTPPGALLFVAGNFNYWDPGDQRFALKLNRDSTYSATLPRGDGTVQYTFTRGDWHSIEADLCGNRTGNRILHYGRNDTVYLTVDSWQDLGPTHCDQVTIIVEKIPESTPAGDSLYLTGTFNNWVADDPAYLIRRNAAGQYYITVPKAGIGAIDFKLTRGSWNSEEVDEYSNLIPNRHFAYGRQDTVRVAVSGWKDIRSANENMVTLWVKVPVNTPVHDKIYLAANFNSWYTRDPSLVLQKSAETGYYTINLPRKAPYVEFKFTRGDWATVEGDRYGNEIGNRSFAFGRKDTLQLQIESWRDVGPIPSAQVR